MKEIYRITMFWAITVLAMMGFIFLSLFMLGIVLTGLWHGALYFIVG